MSQHRSNVGICVIPRSARTPHNVRLLADASIDRDRFLLLWSESLAGDRQRHYLSWNVLIFQTWLEAESAQHSILDAFAGHTRRSFVGTDAI
jgi:hypothetical protein